MTISERIFEIMKTKNLKQKDLSQRIGIPTATISTWNTRHTSPPAEKIPEIADYLGVSVYYLLGMTSDPHLVVKNNGYIMKAEDNGSNVVNNAPAQSSSGADELSEELLKKFKNLSFDEKIEVFNYIKTIKEE